MDELIERLRAVQWEEADDCDRMPDDPTHECVFVDMRPDDFRALLEEAAAALEAARKDAARLDWLADRDNPIGNVQLPSVCVTNNMHDMRAAIDEAMRLDPELDAAIDQARGKGVEDAALAHGGE